MTSINYPIAARAHTINGVPGTMKAINTPAPAQRNGRLVHRIQKWISAPRNHPDYGHSSKMYVEIRFDDQCGNGHQTFAITAHITTPQSLRRNDWEAGGCLHDDIAKIFPELEPLIDWHLTDTDSPLHYAASAAYYASDRDYNGRKAGEPCSWETVIYFGNSPVSHEICDKFAAFIRSRMGTGDFQVIALRHNDNDKPGSYQYSDKYTFAGFGERWHECPFNDKCAADEWAQAINSGDFRFDKRVTRYSEGKKRDLKAARAAAKWPEATDEQLCLPRAELEALLNARLPALIAEFKDAMINAGFMWEPEQ